MWDEGPEAEVVTRASRVAEGELLLIADLRFQIAELAENLLAPRPILQSEILLLQSVFIFLVPRHLNGLELGLVRELGVAGESGQLGHVAMQVGEAHRQ